MPAGAGVRRFFAGVARRASHDCEAVLAQRPDDSESLRRLSVARRVLAKSRYYDEARAFELGLDLIVDGLEALSRRTVGSSRSTRKGRGGAC